MQPPSKRRLGLAEQVEDEVFGKPPKSLEHAHFKPSTHFLLDHRKMFGQSRGPFHQRIGATTGQEADCYRRRGAANRIILLAQALELQRVRQR